MSGHLEYSSIKYNYKITDFIKVTLSSKAQEDVQSLE